jgi:maltose-binding protein MalE
MSRARGLVLLFGLSSLLAACGSLGLNRLPAVGNTINVVLELSSQADPVELSRLKALLEQEAREFKQLNPQLQVKLRTVAADRLQPELAFRTARGLAPDLVLLATSRDLLTLHQKGYATPVPLNSEERRHVQPGLLASLRDDGQQLGVPLFMAPTLACFNRRRLPSPPAKLSDLVRLGQEGSAIGLSSSLSGLEWILSGFGASLIPPPSGLSRGPSQVLSALQWLQHANLQPHITFVSSEEELRRGLAEGRFLWVPCSSGWIPSLRQALGADLGVGLLPAGPVGPARPLMVVPTWMLGSQSSPSQRRLAKQFVLFTANAVNQRTTALRLGTVLPVNPAIALPLKAYPILAVMDGSRRQSVLPSLQQYQVLDRYTEQVVLFANQVLAGARAPLAVAPEFQRLLDAVPAAEVQP